MKKYVFVSRRKIFAASVFDSLGRRIFSSKNIYQLTSDVNRITILLLDHIGDVMLATSAISRIRENFKDSEICLIAGSWGKELIEADNDIDHLIIFDAPWFDRDKKMSQLSGIIALKNILIELNADLAIDFRGDMRHNLAMYLARVPHRVGFGITGGGFLLTDEADFPFKSHAVLRNAALLDKLGIKYKEEELSINIPVSKEALLWVEEFLREKKLSDKLLIGIHPEAGTQAKQWPSDNFSELIDLLAVETKNREPIFIVTGTKKSIPTKPNVIELTGKLSLMQLAALQSRLDLFICGDTGPLHMAAALNCPTVAIYSGTNDVNIWGPWKGDVKVLKIDIDCAPCGKKVCDDKACLKEISPQMVATSAINMLSRAE